MTNDSIYEKLRSYTDAFHASHGEFPGVYIETLGCQQNEADSEKLLGMARSAGYRPVLSAEDASLVIVNTCAIRDHAEQRALSIIGRHKQHASEDPEFILCVCGCMAARAERAEQLKHSFPYVDLLFVPAALSMFPELLFERLTRGKRVFRTEASPEPPADLPTVRGDSLKAWVSIMYGCNNFCSYCIVPYCRDRERSRSGSSICTETAGLVADGYRDITLLGQNVNSYGKGTDLTFPELLDELASIPGDYWLRFMTSHPKDVSPRLIEVMASHPDHIARHFHLPLQSGSDEILRRMNRHYDLERYLSIVHALRDAMPDITLTSDIIVGFPGETEEQFASTLSAVEEAGFDMIYPFNYSPRPGTPAASYPDQIPDAIKSERFDRLIELQNRISFSNNARMIGRTVRVLVDNTDHTKESCSAAGRTSGYQLVHIRDTGVPVTRGQFVDVRITGADTYSLAGELVAHTE